MKKANYQKNSITLMGAVGLGTGVMVGAAIFAIIGQVAELAGALFPLAYIGGAVIAACSAYAYVKMSNAYPSAGGVGLFFVKIYGKGTIAASSSLLMAVSMVIAQSLVARTFGTYTLQLFNIGPESPLVPVLGVGLLILTYFINISSNRFIQGFASTASFIKIVGLFLFSLAALWVSHFSLEGIIGSIPGSVPDQPLVGFIASMALSILAFKGFTTITNNGSEIVNPHKNIGRAITISIAICAFLYLFISWAVSSSLSIPEIVKAKDYALAAAARPVLGTYGLWFTVVIAILATITVSIGSVFAVTRMTTMLTDMKLIPHSHFGMSGTVQRHMLIYIIVIAITLTIFFDLSRMASLGAIFYLLMDIIFQWGVLNKLRNTIEAKPYIIIAAILLDITALGAFIWMKGRTDPLIIALAAIFIFAIFIGEQIFLKVISASKKDD